MRLAHLLSLRTSVERGVDVARAIGTPCSFRCAIRRATPGISGASCQLQDSEGGVVSGWSADARWTDGGTPLKGGGAAASQPAPIAPVAQQRLALLVQLGAGAVDAQLPCHGGPGLCRAHAQRGGGRLRRQLLAVRLHHAAHHLQHHRLHSSAAA